MKTFNFVGIFLVVCLIMSCHESKQNTKRLYKYHVGDVVSLKPDGQRATIMTRYNVSDSYDYVVKYYSADDERYAEDLIKEFEIFNKVN